VAQLVIDPRYEGIPGVAHGGYLAGVAAKELGGPVTVTLTRVVQPGSSVTLERHDAEVMLRVGDEVPDRVLFVHLSERPSNRELRAVARSFR
jgi:hypothetical protein